MANPTEFLAINLNLPDHKQQLSDIKNRLENLKQRLDQIKLKGNITDDIHESMYDETVLILDFIGKLSRPIFGLQQTIETEYFQKFKSNPKLSKRLWYNHYEHIHKPYTTLKNKCYDILETLDYEFIDRHKRPPRNYIV